MSQSPFTSIEYAPPIASMDHFAWDHVRYIAEEEKLVLVDINLSYIPLPIINLYADKTVHLDLSWNCITNLDCLRMFTHLETLVLDNNCLDDTVFRSYNGNQFPLKTIKTLSLNNNKIEDLTLLLLLLANDFPNLEYLSLLGNPACPFAIKSEQINCDGKYDTYRSAVIEALPKIKFLDYGRIGKNFSGSFLRRHTKVLKFSPKMILAKFRITPLSAETIYSPLPDTIRVPGEHSGIYGVRNYKYVGKHSEGNRFILNSDL